MNKSPEIEKYIFEQGEKRERTAIVRLIADKSSSLSEVFREQFNIALPWCWIGIRIPQRVLLKGLELKKDEFLGDIDFMAGNLKPKSQETFLKYVEEFKDDKAHPSWAYKLASLRTAHNGEIEWIPNLDYIVASECKATYLNADGILKGAKLNEKAQKGSR